MERIRTAGSKEEALAIVAKLGFGKKELPTETERTRVLKTQAFSVARPELERSVRKDGFIDPRVYVKLRNDYAQAIGDVGDFDDTFSTMLSPQDRVNIGVQNAVSLVTLETPPFEPTPEPTPAKKWWQFWK